MTLEIYRESVLNVGVFSFEKVTGTAYLHEVDTLVGYACPPLKRECVLMLLGRQVIIQKRISFPIITFKFKTAAAADEIKIKKFPFKFTFLRKESFNKHYAEKLTIVFILSSTST